jgi:hypothetical protein
LAPAEPHPSDINAGMPFRARRLFFLPILSVVLAGVLASGAQGALYRGGGHGVHVVFRTEGRKVVWANVHSRLNCTKEELGRHFGREVRDYAEPSSPLPIDEMGNFSFVDRAPIQEESYEVFEALFGHVGPRAVTGRYEYKFSKSYLPRWVQCQTNTFAYGPSEARFRARRVR